MADISPLSAYRLPQLDTEASTFGAAVGPQEAAKSTEYMDWDLERSGLTADEMGCKPITMGYGNGPRYMIPYFYPTGGHIKDSNGGMLMYRARRKLVTSEQSRYIGPSAKVVGDICRVPYIHPIFHDLPKGHVAICEGEKKALSVMKHLHIPAIGIGGAWNWIEKRGSKKLHPWIMDVLRMHEATHVTIVPDGDIKEFQIIRAYGTLAANLKAEGLEIQVLNSPGSIDDLIVEWGDEAADRFNQIPSLVDLVEDPALLVKQYGLTYSTQGKDAKVIIDVNESNILKLLRRHPSSPRLWFDEDVSAIKLEEGGDVREGQEDMDVLELVQYNFCMPRARMSSVHSAMQRAAYDNRRSPLRDWLDGLEWDGKPRLETWMMDYCGADDTPVVREIGLKWLTAAVARVFNPGCFLDYMVITTGGQGIGKSSLPVILFGQERTIFMLGVENQHKDEVGKMHLGWCVNYDELGAMNTKAKGHLKSVVTCRDDVCRLPFTKNTRVMPRRFTLYASTNEGNFLKSDATGYRRFGVVGIQQVLFKELERDRDQLFAEAVHRYHEGHNFSNLDTADAAAQAHVTVPMHIDLWRDYWEDCQAKSKLGPPMHYLEGWYYFTNQDIARAIDSDWSGRGAVDWQIKDIQEDMVRVGFRQHLSWRKVNGKQLRRVWVISEERMQKKGDN